MKTSISPEPALLGFLSAGPMHGYELYKRVKQELGPVWRLGQSQMYAIVNDYADRGWVKVHLEHQGARPSKKILELSPDGRKAFAAWMAQPAHGLREFRVDFFARLYFAHNTGHAELQRLIEQQTVESRRELLTLQLEQAQALPTESEFRQAIRLFRIEQLTSALQWLETSRIKFDRK